MSSIWEQFDRGPANPAASMWGDFDKQNESSSLRRATDVGVDLAKGVVGVGESVVGLVDLVSFGAAGAGLSAIGFDPKRAKDILGEMYSTQRRRANDKVENAEGFMDTAAAMLANPSTLLGAATEAAPGTAGIVGLGRVVAMRAFELASQTALRAGLSSEAAKEAGIAAVQKAMPRILNTVSAAEGAQAAGSIAEQARQEGREWADYVLPAVGAGAGTAAIGRAAGAVAPKIGLGGDLETHLATTGIGAGGAQTGGIIKSTMKGAAREGVLEELPQSAQEQMFQNIATGRPVDEGVGSAAAQGMLVGGAMGGVHGALSRDAAPQAPARPVDQLVAAKAEIDRLEAETAAAVAKISTARSVDDAINAAVATAAAPPDISQPIEFSQTDVDLGRAQGAYDTAQAREQAQVAQDLAPSVPFEKVPGIIDSQMTPPPPTAQQVERDRAYQALEADRAAVRDKDLEAMVNERRDLDVTLATNESVRQEDAAAAAKPPQNQALKLAMERADAKRRAREGRDLLSRMEAQQRAKPDVVSNEAAGSSIASRKFSNAAPTGTVDEAAHQAAVSPANNLPDPTKPQVLANNAKLGHARLGGLDLSIENPAGSVREDKNNTPPKWRTEMKSHYGYIKGTVGFDKDHVDAFVKAGTPEDWSGTVYVVNQKKPGGKFDEHKAMLGFDSEEAARAGYLDNYDKGFEKNVASVVAMPLRAFKAWAHDKSEAGPKGGLLKPVTILGVEPSKLTRDSLKVAARSARTEVQRAAATAELERRDAPQPRASARIAAGRQGDVSASGTATSAGDSQPMADTEAEVHAQPITTAKVAPAINQDELKNYAAKVVAGGKVRSVHLVGSAATSATPNDVDLLYELEPGLDDEAAVEEALESIDGLDLDKFDTFVKSGERYYHVSGGAGRTVVANDDYGTEQAGKPRVELASGAKAPKFSRGEPSKGINRATLRAEVVKAFGDRAAAKVMDAGILVPVEKQTQLPDHVVPFLREGDKVYGFYDPDTDRTYAVLENLSASQVRGLVLHEVGVHYGFKRMLGEAKYEQVMRRLDAMRKAGNKNVQQAFDTATKESAESDQVAEETLAYLVQKQTKMSLVEEVLAAIKTFLYRNFGIGADSLTEADLALLARAAVMKAGLEKSEPAPKPAAAPRVLAPAFTKEGDEKKEPDFKTMIRQLIKGERDKRLAVVVADKSPPVARVLGMADLPIAIPGSIPDKMMFDHALTEAQVARLPELLADPVLVFESETHPGTYVFVTTEFVQKMPLVFTVRPDGVMGREQAHIVTSGYPRAKARDAFTRWLKAGLLRYVDQAKRPGWQRSAGLQLPGEMLTRGAGRSLLTQSDLVKNPPAAATPVEKTPAEPAKPAGEAPEIKKSPGGGTNENPQAPAPKFSRAAWVDQQPAETQEALRKAGVWYTPPTLKERVQAWKGDWAKRVRQGVVDQFDPIKEYDYKAYVLARMTRSADAALEAVLNYGTIKLDSDGAIDVDFEKGGFLGVMKELQGEHERFLAWVIGNRAERLKSEDREHNFTDDDIQRLKALNQGEMQDGSSRTQLYAKAKQSLDRYNKTVMDVAERAGLVDGETRSAWEKDFYVPFYRLMEEEGTKGPIPAKGLVNQYAFKVLKGGEQALGDPLENVLKNWSHLIDASLKNQAARAALTAAEKVGAVIEADEATAKQMSKAIDKKRGVVSFVDQGTQRWFVVEDPFLLDAMKSIGFMGFSGPAMKMMQNFKRWLTLGVTVSPTFRIRNIIRDSLSMIGTNPASYNVLDNLLTGWKATKDNTPEFASLLAGGGVMRFGSSLEGDRAAHVKKLIEAGVPADTILNTPKKIKAMLQQSWDWWQHVGDRAENVNRAALYKKLRAEGKTHLEASFAARDVMDFSMQGTWAAIRFLTQTVPFMNARLQGLYKLGRGAVEDPRRFGIVLGATMLATIALMLANKDDDDWKQREDWDRETFWWFKIGDKAFRIPKPFELGAVATIAERGLEAMITDDLTGRQFANRVYNIISEQLSLNPVPQLLKPMIEVYANRDSFTNRPIETMGMEKLSPSQRAGPNTSATAQLAGKNGFVSPVQIDHLVRGYFGWLGSHVVAAADLALRPAMSLPPEPAWKTDDLLVAGDFVKDLPAQQSKYVTRLYDQVKSVEEAMADLRHFQKIGATEKAHEILQDQGDKIRLYRLYTHAEKQLAAVNRQINMVKSRATIDADDKRERLDALYGMRNRIAQVTEARSKEISARAR